MTKVYKKLSILLILFIFVSGFTTQISNADEVSALREKITDRTRQIEQIEAEIAEYRKQIEQTGDQAKTLQNAIKALDLNRQKLLTDLKLTQNKLDLTQLTIVELQNDISDIEANIDRNRQAVALSLREIQQADDISLVQAFLN